MALDPDTLKALITAGGAGLEAVAGGLQQSKNRKDLAKQALIGGLQNERNLQGSRGAQSAALLGGGPYEASNQLQHELTKRALLGGARNVSITAPDEISPYVGQISGGLRIPEGGLDVSALSDQSLGESGRAYYSAAAQANPYLELPNLGTLGLGQAGTDASGRVEAARGGFLQDDQAKQKEILNQLYGEQDSAQSGGFWHKLGGILKIAGPIAAMAIPGVGPLLGTALAAGSSAGGDLLQGADWKKALVSGALAGGGANIPGARNIFKIPSKNINSSMIL